MEFLLEIFSESGKKQLISVSIAAMLFASKKESHMEIEVIGSDQRGLTQTGWLHSRHTYSFGSYHNLKRLNFGTLRVFNDDIIKPGKGFGLHFHENMEIVTIVLDGALEHKDSEGNKGVLHFGDVQRMSAGKGIEHSEYNASKEEPVHFLQIWIYPRMQDLDPSYEQKHFDFLAMEDQLIPIARSYPSPETLEVHQDTALYFGNFASRKKIEHHLHMPNRGVYLFMIDGELILGDSTLGRGDSAQISSVSHLSMKTKQASQFILIEVGIATL